MQQASATKDKLLNTLSLSLKPFIRKTINHFLGGQGHILMFHKVRPQSTTPRIWANAYLEVTPAYLEELILLYKKEGYRFITFDELLQEKDSKKRQQPFVIFTFDDGYRDNLLFAEPVFNKHNIPFTIYVTTHFPDNKAILWWDDLEDYLLTNDRIQLNTQEGKLTLRLHSATDKLKAFNHLHSTAQTMGLESWLSTFYNQLQINPYGQVEKEALTWCEVNSLANHHLCTIGAHTVSHRMLSSLTEDEAFIELKESKMKLEKKCNTAIQHLAYPYGGQGEFTETNVNQAKSLGYTSAVTTITGNIRPKTLYEPFRLPRIAVGMSMGFAKQKVLISGLYPYLR